MSKEKVQELFQAYRQAQNKDQIQVVGLATSSKTKEEHGQESRSYLALKKAIDYAEKQYDCETKIFKLQNYVEYPEDLSGVNLKIGTCRCCYSASPNHCNFYSEKNQDGTYKVAGCNCFPNDKLTTEVGPAIMNADVLLWATPVTEHNMSSMAKIVVDRMIFFKACDGPRDKPSLEQHREKWIETNGRIEYPKRLHNKVCGYIITNQTDGAFSAATNLMKSMLHLGASHPPNCIWYWTHGKDCVESTFTAQEDFKRDISNDQSSIVEIGHFIHNCVELAKRLKRDPVDFRHNIYCTD